MLSLLWVRQWQDIYCQWFEGLAEALKERFHLVGEGRSMLRLYYDPTSTLGHKRNKGPCQFMTKPFGDTVYRHRFFVIFVAQQSFFQMFDSDHLIKIVTTKMPFGKYKGYTLCNLPVSYLEWFQRKGFPEGKLGGYLHTVYEIKLNGLEHLLVPIKNGSLL